jgi:hypothetical protein
MLCTLPKMMIVIAIKTISINFRIGILYYINKIKDRKKSSSRDKIFPLQFF